MSSSVLMSAPWPGGENTREQLLEGPLPEQDQTLHDITAKPQPRQAIIQ